MDIIHRVVRDRGQHRKESINLISSIPTTTCGQEMRRDFNGVIWTQIIELSNVREKIRQNISFPPKRAVTEPTMESVMVMIPARVADAKTFSVGQVSI